MNFLKLLLCLTLQQPYILHYFVALITYSYTLTAVTMAFWLILTQVIATKYGSVDEKMRLVAFATVFLASILLSIVLKLYDVLFDALFFTG